MERFRVFLDYGRRRIILEPAGPLDAPFSQATCGCSIAAEGAGFHRFRVDAVIDGWPAATAGLHAGDVIAAVDGRSAADLTLTDLLALLESPVARRLDVVRGTARTHVTLTPRPLP